MSLKAFHVLLISLSSLLGLFFGGWSVRAWQETDKLQHLVLAIFSFAGAVSLMIYVVWFIRKIRTRDEEDKRRRDLIRPLALLAVISLMSWQPANACTVCYGEAEGPMIEAARLGVWLLFGLVLAVQAAFVLFFLHLRRRARAYQEAHPETNWVD